MKTGIFFLLLAAGCISAAVYLASDTRANIQAAGPAPDPHRPQRGEPAGFRGAESVPPATAGEATTADDIARQLENLESELRDGERGQADFSIEKAIAGQDFSLTPLQKQVRDTPPIARIKSVLVDEGFVVLDAGLDQNLRAGMTLAVRREYYIVAKLIVGETVDTTESIANIAPNSIPTGIGLRAGDAVIPWAEVVALKAAPSGQ